MVKGALDIRGYTFSGSEEFLVDTNIWYYVYGPQPQPADEAKVYSGALQQMLTAHCSVYVDVLIMSEFANRYARFMFQLQQQTGRKKYKDYRRSDDFSPVAAAITDAIRRITGVAQRLSSGFEKLTEEDLDSLLSLLGSNSHDFNDIIISEICRSKGLTLVTHDADFKELDICILTANVGLLN